MSSCEETKDKALSSSSEKTLWARPILMARSVQTLSPFFSFPLQVWGGNGDSSINTVGERATGVQTVLGMMILVLLLVLRLLAGGVEILDKGASLFHFAWAY